MINNTALHRFERTENGHLVFADYRLHEHSFVITHVEADPALRGTGAAARLMEEMVAYAHASGARLVPRCPYAVAWLKRHPTTFA